MMQPIRFVEPELEFGTGHHVDIRFGLMNNAPFDFESESARKIRVGIVGSPESVEGLRDWLQRCRTPIEAKESRQPNLFPPFPGFNPDCGFHSELLFDSVSERQISSRQISSLVKISVLDELKIEAVRVIVDEVRFLLEKRPPDVIICAIPEEILTAISPPETPVDLNEENAADESSPSQSEIDFHDLLKARCMTLPRACPIQLVLPGTYDPKKRRQRRARREIRPLQDEATRAWNFHTALYYKAGGTPWRLRENPSKLQTCFVGVGFFWTLDKKRIVSSVAQVFNERGNGVVVRGEAAMIAKDDKQIHLDRSGAYELMNRALNQYEKEHRTTPARVVVHKTTSHNEAEIAGFEEAIDEHRIHSCEMLSLRKSSLRLFRNGVYPPLRGTYLQIDEETQILYTRGSVEFFATYPGMYMPRTLEIQCTRREETPRYLAEEILALTKMNWNDTQFDGGLPITLRAARQVGDILKYLGPESIPPHYSFYM